MSGQAGGRNPASILSRGVVLVLLTAGAFVSLYPFYAMAVSATHSTAELFQTPPPFWFGDQLAENLARLQEEIGFGRVVVNSLLIAVIYTALGSLVSALAGYGFAKHRFRGRNLVFALILATMFIPYQVTLVPLFQLMSALKWVNSYQAVILPFLASAFGIFLMRQGFLSFPDEIIESGRIDGAGELRIFYSLVLPAVRPQLAALVIYTFMTQWSAFIWPLLMLSNEQQYTIPVALNTLIGQSHVDYAGLMLGSFVATLPMLVVFLVFQRQFIAGLLGGSVKG
jgi:lactose/L-arabinose transport system permease protein